MIGINEPRSGFSRSVAAGMTLAAIASGISLILAAGVERRAAGFATFPFGWNRVIVMHVLSTLVLSWWLARALGRLWPALTTRRMTALWFVLGISAASATIAAGPVLANGLSDRLAGDVTRFAMRVVWCAGLQVAWCMAGLSASVAVDVHEPTAFSSSNLFVLAIVTAVGVPMSFHVVFIEQQALIANAAWRSGKITEARRLAERLSDLSRTVSLGERASPQNQFGESIPITPMQALADLDLTVEALEQAIEQLRSQQPSVQRQIQLAKCYLALDDAPAAREALRAGADEHPAGALLLAEISKNEAQIDVGRSWAKRTLALAQAVEPADASQAEALEEMQLRAYDLLVVWAGEQADFDAAEQYLFEAFTQLPNRRAEMHHRLGKHYEYVGDLVKAVSHQHKAAQLAPDRFPPPESLVAKMLGTGAPIGLARPKSSRYR